MPSEPARPDPAALVDSVRGRRLLWELLAPLDTDIPWWSHERAPADDVVLASVRRRAEVARDRGPTPLDLCIALSATVDTARYWQPPDDIEAVLARPAVREALLPVAAMVVEAAPTWWSAPLDLATQHRVRWVDERIATPPPAPDLAAWHAAVVADEARFAAEHRKSDRPWGGEWWSTPGYLFATTTRAAGGLPAVHLALVEDESGWTAADIEPVTVPAPPRVHEVTSAADWAALVARWPLEVTHSRRHDWRATTGRLGRWFLPDYAAVAGAFDAVHVTVAGYLATTGAAVPVPGVPDGATVLAGWSPDQTWWLRPELLTAGPSRRWQRADDAEHPWEWVPVA